MSVTIAILKLVLLVAAEPAELRQRGRCRERSEHRADRLDERSFTCPPYEVSLPP